MRQSSSGRYISVYNNEGLGLPFLGHISQGMCPKPDMSVQLYGGSMPEKMTLHTEALGKVNM